MEKPPTREEIMFDWFLGEAKDIAASLKEGSQMLVAVRDDITSAKNDLSKTVDKITRELVESHRDLTIAIQHASVEQKKGAGSLYAAVNMATASNQGKTLSLSFLSALSGAFLGTLVAFSIIHLLTH